MTNWTFLSPRCPALRFALPFAGALFALALWIPFFRLILDYCIQIPLHETGHSLTAWLASHFALPIGAILPMAAVSWISFSQNILVGLVVAGGIGFLAYQGVRRKSGPLCLVSAVLAICFLKLTFLVPADDRVRWILLNGQGGELFLGAGLLLLGYYELPEAWHWDFFRPFVMAIGGYGYLNAAWKWFSISRRTQELPMGSFLSGRESGDGDIDRLFEMYGYTEKTIVSHYLSIAVLLGIFIVVHYAYGLLFAENREPTESTAPGNG